MDHINVELLEFLRSGRFGPIALGMNRTQVEAALGKPQEWGGNWHDWSDEMKRRDRNRELSYTEYPIWVYDAMEFHFEGNQQLWLIYCDHLDWLTDHGQLFNLNLWIFETSRKISREQFIQALTEEHLLYREKSDQYVGTIILPSGVEALYDLDSPDEIVTIKMSSLQHWDTEHLLDSVRG